jgi:hypothetical protein
MTLCVRRSPTVAARPAVAAAAALACVLTATPARADQNLDILYVNRCTGGCVVHAGFDSAINNTSSLVTANRTVPAFPFPDAVFDATVTCLRSVFAPYDVTVTTQDPGAVPHRELMIGGLPSAIGQSSGVTGVAPFSGAPIANAIAFAFALQIGEDVDLLCYNAAHELGHLYGLDHEFYCPDLLTYLMTCAGAKTFTDFDARCGEGAERDCVQGPSTQNSHAVLAAVAGQDEVVFRNGCEEAGPLFEQPFAAGLVEPLVCGTATAR